MTNLKKNIKIYNLLTSMIIDVYGSVV